MQVFKYIITFAVLCITFLFGVLTGKHLSKKVIEEKVEVKLEQPEFLMSDNPAKDLPKVLEYYDVQHPDIVRAQAILETGHFRSIVFKKYNNLFGLYNSRKKDYYKFNHWTESVLGYLNFIQYRYKPPNDYYQFLQKIGYAEDSLYISKLKSIQSRFKYESDNNN